MRRQPVYLIVIVNVLIVAVAATASVDLRRLRTPGGVGLRWTQAALFGDCSDYLRFSVAAAPEDRARHELCDDLSKATQQARTNSAQIGLRLGTVRESGSTALVDVRLTRSGALTLLRLRLVKRDGSWKVLRDSETCASVGCA